MWARSVCQRDRNHFFSSRWFIALERTNLNTTWTARPTSGGHRSTRNPHPDPEVWEIKGVSNQAPKPAGDAAGRGGRASRSVAAANRSGTEPSAGRCRPDTANGRRTAVERPPAPAGRQRTAGANGQGQGPSPGRGERPGPAGEGRQQPGRLRGHEQPLTAAARSGVRWATASRRSAGRPAP